MVRRLSYAPPYGLFDTAWATRLEFVARRDADSNARGHTRVDGRHQRIVDPAHWEGLTRRPKDVSEPAAIVEESEFGRSLDVYAAIAEGVAA